MSAALSLALCLPGASWAKEYKDSTGATVQVADHPSRIVALAPSVAELAAEFLGSDLQRIIGVSENTDYPPSLAKAESIGPYYRFNLEKVSALKPDLVLATRQGNSKDQVMHLRELGLPVFVLDTGSFSDIESAMGTMAELLGDAQDGPLMAASFRKRLEALKARGLARLKSGPPPRVLIQLDDSPLIVVGGEGGKSFLTEALHAVGAENVYQDAAQGYPRPSVEDVLKRDPDDIFVMSFGPDQRRFQAMAARWTSFPGLAAVRNKSVKVIYAETLLRPSMRVLEGLAVLERALYGKN